MGEEFLQDFSDGIQVRRSFNAPYTISATVAMMVFNGTVKGILKFFKPLLFSDQFY
jgi:hypothetical protein